MAVGVVGALATVLGVAAAAHWALLPGLGWTAAVLLGVAAALFETRLFQEAGGSPHVPRALTDALKAREMASRIAALTVFALAMTALREGEVPEPGQAALAVAWDLLGGAAVGVAIGRAVLWLRDRAGPAPIEIAVSAAGILALVLAIQWLGSLLSTRLPPLRAALAEADAAGVMAWASTRSVLGLIVVLSVPEAAPDGRPFDERGLLLAVSALVILGSVAVQGLTLGWAVRGAALGDGGEARREEEHARHSTTMARHEAGLAEDAADPEGFAAERRALARLRERDEIGDEIFRRLLREADLRRRASQGDASPGAPPPQP